MPTAFSVLTSRSVNESCFFGGGGGVQAKLQNFTVSRHILISCSSETIKGGGDYTFPESSLQDQFRN